MSSSTKFYFEDIEKDLFTSSLLKESVTSREKKKNFYIRIGKWLGRKTKAEKCLKEVSVCDENTILKSGNTLTFSRFPCKNPNRRKCRRVHPIVKEPATNKVSKRKSSSGNSHHVDFKERHQRSVVTIMVGRIPVKKYIPRLHVIHEMEQDEM